jgi:hypothetical protein
LSYLLARCAYRTCSDRAALGLIVGYFDAAVRRRARYHDPQVRAALRERQRIRHFVTVLRGRVSQRGPLEINPGAGALLVGASPGGRPDSRET